jgi:uncharacterized protein with HEPN domain
MQRDARAYLHDACTAAGLIVEFLGKSSLDDYRNNALLKSAVERQFEILGEACNQFAKLEPGHAEQIPNLRRIVDFRNVLAHAYAVVDDELVWGAATGNIPLLQRRLKDMLSKLADR